MQYLNNAVEDIGRRTILREQALKEELEGNIVMIQMDLAAVEKEKQKVAARKAHEAALQERLYQENLESLARKEHLKLSEWEKDKYVFYKTLTPKSCFALKFKPFNHHLFFKKLERLLKQLN